MRATTWVPEGLDVACTDIRSHALSQPVPWATGSGSGSGSDALPTPAAAYLPIIPLLPVPAQLTPASNAYNSDRRPRRLATVIIITQLALNTRAVSHLRLQPLPPLARGCAKHSPPTIPSCCRHRPHSPPPPPNRHAPLTPSRPHASSSHGSASAHPPARPPACLLPCCLTSCIATPLQLRLRPPLTAAAY